MAIRKAQEPEQAHARRQVGLPTGVRCLALFESERQELPKLAVGAQAAYRAMVKSI